jgi:CheY-like chemotaxis protein
MTSLAGKKILVVDDEELLREILMEDLAYCGATVDGAENGTAAFDLVNHEHFDAVITDVRMPGGSGIALAKNIMSRLKKEDRPKIFLCSGYNDVSPSEISDLEISHVFAKPFDRENFINVISNNLKS